VTASSTRRRSTSEALALRELPDAHGDARVDRVEQRCLSGGDPERSELAAEVPVQPQQHRAQLVRHVERIGPFVGADAIHFR